MDVMPLTKGYQVKRTLMACRDAGFRQRQLEMEYRDCAMINVAHVGNDGMPKAKGSKQSIVENLAVRLADIADRQSKAAKRYTYWRKEAEKLIDLCEDERMRRLITARFVDCLSWSGVAREAGYSDRCNAIRDTWKGVELIQQKIDEVSMENT